jgi:hypothetical protein
MSRPVMSTGAPIAASQVAVALPIPPVPPVTRTVWPAIGPAWMPDIADIRVRKFPGRPAAITRTHTIASAPIPIQAKPG